MNFHVNEENRLKIKLIATVTGVLMGFYLFFRYLFVLIWPIAVSFFLAMLLYPVVRFLQVKCRIKKMFGITLVVILLSAGLALGIGFLLRKLAGQLELLVQNYAVYEAKIMEITKDICRMTERIFSIKTGNLYPVLEEGMETVTEGLQQKLIQFLIGTSLPALRFFVNALIAGAIAIVAFFLLLKDMESIQNSAKESVFSKEISFLYRRCETVGKAYIRAQLIIMCIVAACSVLGLFIAGNPYAWLLGLLVGCLDALPFFGSGFVLIPVTLLALVQKKFFSAAVVFTTFFFCYFLREYLEPKLMGDKMGVSPVLTLAGIYAGYQLFGFLGMIVGSLAVILLTDIWKQVK